MMTGAPQLRAHLCYLKFNDAAEVLPYIGEARAERLSLNEAWGGCNPGPWTCLAHAHRGKQPVQLIARPSLIADRQHRPVSVLADGPPGRRLIVMSA